MATAAFSASGTLVATTLEAVGYLNQEYILDTLSAPLGSSVAGFIYIFAFILAMTALVTTGRFKLGLWFVFGPVLFFAVLCSRTDSELPHWQYGGEPRNDDAVSQQVANVICDQSQGSTVQTACDGTSLAPTTAKVSALFAGYDNVVSETVQNIVKIISSTRVQPDYLFLMRSQIYGMLVNAFVTDADLRDLFQNGFLRQCAPIIQKAQQMQKQDETGQTVIDETMRQDFDTAMNSSTVVLNDQLAMRYVAGMFVDYDGATGNTLWLGPQSNETIDQWLTDVTAREQAGGFETDPGKREKLLSDARPQIAQWLSQNRGGGSATFTCADVWGMSFAGFHREARQQIMRAVDYANKARASTLPGAETVPPDQNEEFTVKLIGDLLKVEGYTEANMPASLDDKVNVLTKIVAKYMMKGDVARRSSSSFLSTYVDRSIEISHLRNAQGSTGNPLLEAERQTRAMGEWAEKTEAFGVAANLPYYQGLILYFLSIAFPFFALMLLIPGKHEAFLGWFALWLWAKSWDIGFAVVMCMDDILYSLMGAGKAPVGGGTPVAAELANGIPEFLASLKNVDPTFSPATYYLIMGTALMAIPPVMAQIILSGLKGGVGALGSGMAGRVQSSIQTATSRLQQRAEGAEAIKHIESVRQTQFAYNIGQIQQGLQRWNQGQELGGLAQNSVVDLDLAPEPLHDERVREGFAADHVHGLSMGLGADDAAVASASLNQNQRRDRDSARQSGIDGLGGPPPAGQTTAAPGNIVTRLADSIAKGTGKMADISDPILAAVVKTELNRRLAARGLVGSWSVAQATESPYIQQTSATMGYSSSAEIPVSTSMAINPMVDYIISGDTYSMQMIKAITQGVKAGTK